MKKAIFIFASLYYFLGNLIFPLGDFSQLQDLPAMYNHCKTFEDKDMSAIDFITDHLLNLDGMFDKHEHGDPQKPHNATLIHHQLIPTVLISSAPLAQQSFIKIGSKENIFRTHFIPSGHISQLFRPPII